MVQTETDYIGGTAQWQLRAPRSFHPSYFWRRKRCVCLWSQRRLFFGGCWAPAGYKRKLIISNLGLHKWPFLLHVWNKHHEYNNFCVQLVQKFQILTEKINIEVLLVAHRFNPKIDLSKIKVAQMFRVHSRVSQEKCTRPTDSVNNS